ncbi:MAG: (2Fe-2S)-binding protein [Desulfobacterium sp.]|nr:(2Fe-2S)-binding protein [Desulfobacterium sp.]MBU3950327.1 (2Fe-2S)-binding protein [Pseudomonadota bacterium]MBU4036816.1 (2Fe-2S)-binding protein [Pseudomonadota bacterium]
MEEDNKNKHIHLTRRSFFSTMGMGAATVVASNNLAAWASEENKVMDPTEPTKITLKINGQTHRILVEPRWSLLFVLREHLGLSAAKTGCERGECGACTVLIDNVPRYACMTLAVEAQGTEIVTLEGLMKGEELGHVQQAFLEQDAFQCGYCTPGQIMAADGLLRSNPKPTDGEIRKGMSGNLCRCGAYHNIFQAVNRAVELKGGG